MRHAVIALLLVVVLAGCAGRSPRPTVVPRQGQSEEEIAVDRKQCASEAQLISSYSPGSVVGFWSRAVIVYGALTLAVVVLVMAAPRRQPTVSGGAHQMAVAGAASVAPWVGSRPDYETYREKYLECMIRRGYQPEGAQLFQLVPLTESALQPRTGPRPISLAVEALLGESALTPG